MHINILVERCFLTSRQTFNTIIHQINRCHRLKIPSPLCIHMRKTGLHKMRRVLHILPLGLHIHFPRRLQVQGRGRGVGGGGEAGLPRSRQGWGWLWCCCWRRTGGPRPAPWTARFRLEQAQEEALWRNSNKLFTKNISITFMKLRRWSSVSTQR